jgi:hypothetical protein
VFGETVSANEHVDVLRALGEEHGGLSRGVAAPHDRNLLVPAQLPFHGGRAVIDPGPVEALDPGHRKPSVFGARSDDDRPGLDRLSVVDIDSVRLAGTVEPGRGSRHHQLGAEFLGLGVGTRRKALTRDSRGEPR